jgi:hypothetical protein
MEYRLAIGGPEEAVMADMDSESEDIEDWPVSENEAEAAQQAGTATGTSDDDWGEFLLNLLSGSQNSAFSRSPTFPARN